MTKHAWMGLCLALAAWAAPAAAQPAVSEAQIERALWRYRREPSPERVVRAALAARSATPGRIRDAIDRARATGWLPTASGAVRRGQAIDLRALVGDDTRTNVATDDNLMLEARLSFRFDRIAFAPEEPRLMRELRAAEDAERGLSATVVALYFERRRLQLERDLLGLADVTRWVRVLEIEALLDALTGGAYSRMLRRPPPS
ncbi:MAG: hypothetical protein KF729_19410 [Sandaracinaceae bacterium]|nr:hypothetical protein [Sandaracinaceae bacterium]